MRSRPNNSRLSKIGGLIVVPVTATLNGHKALLAIKLAPEAVTPDDAEMLQDLIVAAVNEASRKVDEALQAQLGGLTGGLKIPGLL